MQRAFTIRPFGTKRDAAGAEIDFDKVHRELIAPALVEAGLAGDATGQIVDSGNIREDMFALIIEADIVVCDVTVHNANVFYELGIRHALRKRRSLLIKGVPVVDAAPFDLLTDRFVRYDINNPASACSELANVIRASLASNRETDSPVFSMLPDLPEINPEAIQALPKEISEEIARARAANSAGWLRLLASEVQGLRFQWPALRLIAEGQWYLMDYVGARKTWERVCANYPNDVAGNLTLANVYERQYRAEGRQELLEASNQAIGRALRTGEMTAAQRAEASALQARNLKTLWRLEFERVEDLRQRREIATNRTLLRSYEAYRNAYFEDLNHYWSGLAALQQGTVALALSDEDGWEDIFDSGRQGEFYKDELKRQVEALRPIVSQAIEAGLDRVAPDPRKRADVDTGADLLFLKKERPKEVQAYSERMWAEISSADLLFLAGARDRRVVQAYRDAIPTNAGFAWNATRGQLHLFAQLGINAELANEVIRTIDAVVERPRPDKKALHTVVFAGHRIDEAGRRAPRFPSDRETKARDLIREKLVAVADTSMMRVHVFSSAAPGSDILCHEICRELGIDSTVCLPMPTDSFRRRPEIDESGRIVVSGGDSQRAER
jgi:hypothetical protein